MRGLWVVRTALVSPSAVDHVVDQARQAGFNALLRPGARPRRRLLRSRGSCRAARSSAARPGLRSAGAAARAGARPRGLQVHAWVNVLLSAHFGQPLPPDHVVSEHPEWLMVPRAAAGMRPPRTRRRSRRSCGKPAEADPDVEGFYLSPSAPGVAAQLEAVVRELLRGYPVAGLHLDFIRYPGPGLRLVPAALEDFARSRGLGEWLRAPLADPRRLRATTGATCSTRLAERLARAARAERPGLVVSAAVVPDDAAALHHKFQTWPALALARHPGRGLPDDLHARTSGSSGARSSRRGPTSAGPGALGRASAPTASTSAAWWRGSARRGARRLRRRAVLARVARPRRPAAAARGGVPRRRRLRRRGRCAARVPGPGSVRRARAALLLALGLTSCRSTPAPAPQLPPARATGAGRLGSGNTGAGAGTNVELASRRRRTAGRRTLARPDPRRRRSRR